MAIKPDEADVKKMADALTAVLGALNPLTREERGRVLRSASVFLGEWKGKDPREHGGQDDCG